MSEHVKQLTGRPSKYNDEVQEAADHYVSNYQEYGDLVPTVVGLALVCDVVAKTIYNWATDENPRFLHTVNKIEMLQHRGLVNGGLSGDFNNSITKMMLASNHGYSESQKIDHTSSDSSMSPKGRSLDDFYEDVQTKPVPE